MTEIILTAWPQLAPGTYIVECPDCGHEAIVNVGPHYDPPPIDFECPFMGCSFVGTVQIDVDDRITATFTRKEATDDSQAPHQGGA